MSANLQLEMLPKARVFISYGRRDGEEFASKLRQRLEKEHPEITLWQDRARMEGGVGWWKQITEAIDAVEFINHLTSTELSASIQGSRGRIPCPILA